MKKLNDYAFNVFSQFGEDGIIQRVFEILGVTSNVCIEFGAWDGFHLSNTANLWTNGWKGILIEADEVRYENLLKNAKNYNCRCIKARIAPEGRNSLESILKRDKIFGPVDVLSIDVDGDDYHIFSSLDELRPRLIICEYNPTIPIHVDLIPEPGGYFGCSALSLVKLAERKNYKLIGMTESNCFFIREQDVHLFSDHETSLQALATIKHLTYLITGYAGDYIASRTPTYGCTVPSKQKFVVGESFSFPQTVPSNEPNRSTGNPVNSKNHNGLFGFIHKIKTKFRRNTLSEWHPPTK
jgi:hypothetical protein